MALAEVIVAAVVMSALAAAIMTTTGYQVRNHKSIQNVGDRDRLFDSMVRTLQNENNLRHSFDNGTVFPAPGNANRNTTRSPGNGQIGNCIHSFTTVCSTAGSAVSRPGIPLPGSTGQWIPFVLVKPSASANGAGVIPFLPVAGTEAAPVRYTLDGQRCNTPTATVACPMEAIAYARPQCSTSPCMPADSIAFTVVLRQGVGSSGPIQIRGGSQKTMHHRVLKAELNVPRTLLARQGVKALSCPNIVVGGVVTQQRMIGIGPSGDAICGAVDSCPEGTMFMGTNPNGSPNCQAQPQMQCAAHQEFMGFAPNGSGRIICQDRAYVNCSLGTIATGVNHLGQPICQSLQSGYCYQTLDACAAGFFTQSYSTVCQVTNCAKKNGCQTICDKAATCCRPNG
jgi:type II secretory pathway pseudopilin PulG